MNSSQNRRAVGLFANRQDAEQALYRLRDAGFNMDNVSVVAKNTGSSDHMAGASLDKGEQIRGGAGAGAVAGTATGGLLGLVGSLGVLAIPGVGPVAEVGIVLANTLLGSGIGAAGGSLIGALVGWGVPEEQAAYYNTQVEQGSYLVMLEGTEAEINSAQAVLSDRGIRDWDIFGIPGTPGDRRVGSVDRY
ncbi:hypothetical protein IQ268_04515 [Oculatella sp. LEGE 06141]|nr:hypothetical protein [Oculatella sp. LEGE 06141]